MACATSAKGSPVGEGWSLSIRVRRSSILSSGVQLTLVDIVRAMLWKLVEVRECQGVRYICRSRSEGSLNNLRTSFRPRLISITWG